MPRKDEDFRITDIINPVTIYIVIILWTIIGLLSS